MAQSVEKFNSLSDLYKRVLPAIKTKVSELRRENVKFVDSLDVWNYCIETKWKLKNDLRIYEIVDDILNVDASNIALYVRSNIVKYKKIIDKDENNER